MARAAGRAWTVARRVARIGRVAAPAVLVGLLSGGVATDTAGALPIVVTPPVAGSPPGRLLGVVISADGDWRGTDAVIADSLRAYGIPSVGLKARTYLQGGKTPEQLSADLGSLARTYLDRWGRTGIVFVGYSRGAEVGPFALSRWPADLRGRLRLVALLSPDRAANFHFHAIDLLREVHRPDDLPLLPELEKLNGVAILCIWGVKDRDAVCPDAPDSLVTKLPWPGGHRIGDSSVPVRMILDQLAERGLIAR